MSTKDQIIAQAAAGYADDAPSVRLAIGKVARRLAVRIDEDIALINRRVAKPFLRALGPVGNLALGAAGAAAVTGVLAPAAAIVAIGAISFYGVGNALRKEDRFELLSQVKAQMDAAGEPTPVALADALQAPDYTLPRASERLAGFWKLVSAAAALRLEAVKRAANEKASQARQSVVGTVVGAKDAAVTRVSGAAAAAASSTLRQKDAAVAAVGRAIAPAVGFFRAVANRVHAISAGVQEGVRTYRELSGKAGGSVAPEARVEPRAEPAAKEELPPFTGVVDFLLPLGEPEQFDNRVIAANWELVNEYVPRLTMRPSLDAILAPALHQRFPLVSDVVVDVDPKPAVQAAAPAPVVAESTPVIAEAAPAAAAPEAPKVVEQPAPAKKKLSLAERMRAAAAEPELVAANDFDDMPGPEDFEVSAPRAAAPASKPATTNVFDDEFGAPPGMDDEPSPARTNSAALAF